MRHVFRGRLTYANVTSTLALFLALGGAAYAAGNSLVGSNGAIHGCVAKRGALTVVAVGKRCPRHTRSLLFAQKGQPGPRGLPGAQGTTGQPGTPGTPGAPGGVGITNYQVVNGATVASSGGGQNIASNYAFCPTGTHVIGGGFATSGANTQIFVKNEKPITGTSQDAFLVETTSASPTDAYSMTPYAYCATVAG